MQTFGERLGMRAGISSNYSAGPPGYDEAWSPRRRVGRYDVGYPYTSRRRGGGWGANYGPYAPDFDPWMRPPYYDAYRPWSPGFGGFYDPWMPRSRMESRAWSQYDQYRSDYDNPGLYAEEPGGAAQRAEEAKAVAEQFRKQQEEAEAAAKRAEEQALAAAQEAASEEAAARLRVEASQQLEQAAAAKREAAELSRRKADEDAAEAARAEAAAQASMYDRGAAGPDSRTRDSAPLAQRPMLPLRGVWGPSAGRPF